VQAALDRFAPVGDVLEFASGTGLWTERLLRHARTITAVDAAAETIEINKQRCRSDRITYVQADIFDWTPRRKFDAVFFGFWLSHVPDDRLDGFIAKVVRSLADQGRFFFVDSKREGAIIAAARDNVAVGFDGSIARRTLNDGRSFEIVKVFYDPEALALRLVRHGLIA
jgi:demethylmenaquinone methyltransferase/2-methoxy-6-polyprenyl-1,4-benzoquinol methylase